MPPVNTTRFAGTRRPSLIFAPSHDDEAEALEETPLRLLEHGMLPAFYKAKMYAYPVKRLYRPRPDRQLTAMSWISQAVREATKVRLKPVKPETFANGFILASYMKRSRRGRQ